MNDNSSIYNYKNPQQEYLAEANSILENASEIPRSSNRRPNIIPVPNNSSYYIPELSIYGSTKKECLKLYELYQALGKKANLEN